MTTAPLSSIQPTTEVISSRAMTPREMPRFWRMMARLARLSPTAKGSLPRSSAMRATSAVSRATAVPAPPMAMPTVAAARAGASFTPSPTMARAP